MNELDISEFQASPELINKLYENGFAKHYKAGDLITDEKSYIRSIPIVKSGSVKVVRTEEDGRELLLYYLQPGESCIMSFLGGLHKEKSKVRLEIEEDAEIIFLPIEKVSAFLREYPEWMDYIFRLYNQRFEDLLEVVNAIAFKKVDERLMGLLQTKSELIGSRTLQVTHEQLANELGTARVVVSRLLKQLELNHKVQLGRNRIILL